MRLIGLAVGLVLGLALAPLAAEGQQGGKVWRIGYLAVGSAELDQSWRPALQQGLRDLGYVEGKNITIEWRHAEGRPERLSELATELVRSKVDVIMVYGSGAVVALTKLTNTIPIIMTSAADPVGTGLVVSLARPGGNVTGLSDLHDTLYAFFQEVRRCGELDTGLDGDRVWMTCTCGAAINRNADRD